MKFRFEVGKSRSYYWPHFLQRAKKHSTYKVEVDAGVEIHAVEVEGMTDAWPFWQITRGWKSVLYFLDGKPFTASAMLALMLNLNAKRPDSHVYPGEAVPDPSLGHPRRIDNLQ